MDTRIPLLEHFFFFNSVGEFTGLNITLLLIIIITYTHAHTYTRTLLSPRLY